MNKGHDLNIVMTVFNRLDYTKRTIESLVKTVPEAKILVYDNASTEEGIHEYLRNIQNENISVIFSQINEGFGTGMNEAISLLSEDRKYILLSNNDAEYFEGWYDTCIGLHEKYPQIGILGVWKHTAHGIIEDKGDLIIKDQMPAVGFLMTSARLKEIGEFPQHGPCSTKGGNGEDVGFCIKTFNLGYWVCAPKDDVANHFDGY